MMDQPFIVEVNIVVGPRCGLAHQYTISELEVITGLDFGRLKDFDGKTNPIDGSDYYDKSFLDSPESVMPNAIYGVDDIVF